MCIRKALIFMLAAFTALPVIAADQTNRRLLELGHDIRATLVERPFDTKHAHLTLCDGNQVCLINGHIPFGTGFDSIPPKTYLAELKLHVGNKTYKLDTSDMYDAWGDRPVEIKGTRYMAAHCYDPQSCVVRGLFSDAAGAFVAEWTIVNGVSVRTVLTGASDIVNLFIEHIDPPVFD